MFKNVFNNLRFDRCLIKLDEVEEKFLKSEIIKEDAISFRNIKRSLIKLNERSDIQYFSDTHVEAIASDLEKRINEAVARNYHTVSYASESEKVKRSLNICTVTGKYIVTLEEKEIYFDDEDSAILYAKNNKIY